MGLGDVQLRVEPGYGITGHRGAAVGVDSFRLDAAIGRDGVLDELPGKDPGLGRPDFPVDYLSRVNVDYHVEQVPVSAAGAFQLRDVPGPYFTGAGRQQLGFLPRRGGGVRGALARGAALAQEPVRAGLRAQVAALVEQDRVRLRDRLVGEAGRVQGPQDEFLFFRRQLGGMTKFPSLPCRDGWFRIAVTVQRGAGFPEYPAGAGGSDRVFHRREMRVNELVQLASESALPEMPSSSANAFPAMSSAVRVFPRSDSTLDFRAFSFLFSARSRASSSASALFGAGFPVVAGSVPFSCWARQCSIWEW